MSFTASHKLAPMRRRKPVRPPGFGLTLGVTLAYLSAGVILPLTAVATMASRDGAGKFLTMLGDERVLAAFKLSFGAALGAAIVDTFFGLIVAWVLVRYSFPLKRVVDAFVDLPFALPTAVAGITLTTICAPDGWVGRYFEPLGIKLAFAPVGIVIALIFTGLPFVVRTVQPILEDLDGEIEEAASSLGASRWETFRRVIFPTLVPALLTGFALCFARTVGEYGSVVFISGNLPNETEIVPLLIIFKLEQFDYPAAAALAVVMLVVSFALLLAINALQVWTARRGGGR
jgi:sulfate transport system permease protein